MFLASAASAVDYSKEVRCDFTYYEGGAELRVECPGVAKFMSCNNTCYTKFNVTGTTSEPVCNVSGIEFGLHTAISQAKNEVISSCNKTRAAVCNITGSVDYPRIGGLISTSANDTRSIIKDKIGDIIDCRELESDLKDCENRFKFQAKDLEISRNDSMRFSAEVSELKKQMSDQEWLNWVLLAVGAVGILWGSGVLPAFIKSRGGG
jgi:hypothetical protein